MCAAACGADLLAISAAVSLGIRRRIVLPFPTDVFRAHSVVDRPGTFPWGALYDRYVRESESANDLLVLGFDAKGRDVYEKTNVAILDEALALAEGSGEQAEALVVWDSRLRTEQDYTEHFAREAERRGMSVKNIPIFT